MAMLEQKDTENGKPTGATLLYSSASNHKAATSFYVMHNTAYNSHRAIILANKLSPHNPVICFFKSSFHSLRSVKTDETDEIRTV